MSPELKREFELAEKHARQSGRLDVALQVKAVLRAAVCIQEMPGARKPTAEEQQVWDLVEGFAQRMGATVVESMVIG